MFCSVLKTKGNLDPRLWIVFALVHYIPGSNKRFVLITQPYNCLKIIVTEYLYNRKENENIYKYVYGICNIPHASFDFATFSIRTKDCDLKK